MTGDREQKEAVLTEKEERLLQKYSDGECGVLEKLFVKRVISHNPHATSYLQTIKNSSTAIKSNFSSNEKDVDLWSRVSARIAAEERSEVFLGKRNLYGQQASGIYSWLSGIGLHKVGMGAAGLVAASLMFFAVSPTRVQQPITPSRVASAGINVSQPIELAPVNTASEPIRLLNERIPGSVEVDWMRSDGRVRMLHSQEEGAPIIWIKRRDPLSARSFRDRSSTPRFIDKRVPAALTASAK